MFQEAFNCLSASVILLIDECFDVVSADEHELERLGGSIFDLLLHLLATPQSSVGLLRTLGGSAHALDKFGARIFLTTVGNQLQHWARIIVTMMNSTELSVRSMAVDFLVSLLCGIYSENENIESTSLYILSVLPEVISREIALCDISGLITTMEDIESSLWPLRRALADVEETNPLDDDRVQYELLPSLMILCRSGQAIIDGVLVEIRLRGAPDVDLDTITKSRCAAPTSNFRQFGRSIPPDAIFDSDEESVLEAASFFSHETSLMQKLRWLYTLIDLHIAKEQWLEAAETLVLCAHSLIQWLDHLPHNWRSSQFDLWNYFHRSPWLSSINGPGEQGGHVNTSVMEFANSFLEPDVFIHQKGEAIDKHFLSVEVVCSTIINIIDQIIIAFAEEHKSDDDLIYYHLEELLHDVTTAINAERNVNHSESRSALRQVRTSICSKLAQLTTDNSKRHSKRREYNGSEIYLQVTLHGNKPNRFKESTAIPTFFVWDAPSIIRVAKPTLSIAASMKQENPTESWEECICRAYATLLIKALTSDDDQSPIVIKTRESQDQVTEDEEETTTYISTMMVQRKSFNCSKSRKFFVRHGQDGITEYTLAAEMPHALSRQRALVASEIKMAEVTQT